MANDQLKILAIAMTEEELREVVKEEIEKYIKKNISSTSYRDNLFNKIYNKEKE